MSRRRRIIWLCSLLLVIGGGIGGYYWHWQVTAVDRKVRTLIYECSGWPDTRFEKRLKAMKLSFLLKDKPAPRDERQITEEFRQIGPAAISGLISLLEDENDEVRFNAVFTIAKFGQEDWRPHPQRIPYSVLRHFGGDRVDIQQSPIILADSRSVEPLIKVLLHDKLEEIRTEAAIALGKLGDPRAVEPLASVLLHDPGVIGDVRVEAARALGKIRDSKAIDALIQVLQSVTFEAPSWIPKGAYYLYSEVDIEVIKSLGNFKDTRIVDLLIKKIGESKSMTDGYPFSNALMGKEEIVSCPEYPYSVRCNIIKSLAKIGDRRAYETLAAILQDDIDHRIRPDAAEALGVLGDFRATDVLVDKMKNDKDNTVCHAAAFALGKLGDRRAIEPLFQTMQGDKDAWLRKAVAIALGELGDTRAIPALEDALKPERQADEKYIEELIARLKSSKTQPATAATAPGD